MTGSAPRSERGLERAPPRGRYRVMEELTLTPRPVSRRSPEPAAWALPPVHRFDGRAANDQTPVPTPEKTRTSAWVVVIAGAVVAALLGLVLGGMLAA